MRLMTSSVPEEAWYEIHVGRKDNMVLLLYTVTMTIFVAMQERFSKGITIQWSLMNMSQQINK